MQIAGNIFLKKALYREVSVFFIVSIFCPFLFATECSLQGNAEKVEWDYVADGDTVWLKDGRKVRFAGINTPEIAHKDRAAEPRGDQAHSTLKKLLSPSPYLLLEIAERPYDHYGRLLASPFLPDGTSINSLLLEQGLAFQVFSENRNPYQFCWSELEKKAREKGLGVWKKWQLLDVRADRLKSGFQVVRGYISNIYRPKSGQSIWLEFDGPLVIRLDKERVSKAWLKSLKGQKVEVRGWLVDRRKKTTLKTHQKPWVVNVYSIDAIKRL
nr:thermonuclease family protein [Endozoicomonas sp. OPT23]